MAFARLERDAWTDPSVAAAYHDLWTQFVAPAIPRLLDSALVGSGDRVLDVAAGPGPVSRAAAARGADPVALDFSLPMLRSIGPNVPRVRADAMRLPIRSASVDRVVSNLGLLHFPEPEVALREAARVVRPGGVVAFSVWGAEAKALTIIPDSLRALGLSSTSPAAPGFFRFGEPGTFEGAMRTAGLIPLPSERVEWSGPVQDPAAFWRMFRSGSARTRASILALSEADQLRLQGEVERRLKPFQVGDTLAVPTTVVVGRGRRATAP
ncbi:MAG: methyltransferase domain-containing protein [Thermoplasmata archaeon]|nr:methyltransferase domain-containing protein [Thermoplasmata archaeon]